MLEVNPASDMGVGHRFGLSYSLVLEKQIHVVLPSCRHCSTAITPGIYFLVWVFRMELLAICDSQIILLRFFEWGFFFRGKFVLSSVHSSFQAQVLVWL